MTHRSNEEAPPGSSGASCDALAGGSLPSDTLAILDPQGRRPRIVLIGTGETWLLGATDGRGATIYGNSLDTSTAWAAADALNARLGWPLEWVMGKPTPAEQVQQ
tara:strand:- start:322 stop:636 length:315 start_codon:yes stop_codon:yes gene_type:complete